MPIKINEIEFIEEALIGRMPPIVKMILETPPLFQLTDNSWKEFYRKSSFNR